MPNSDAQVSFCSKYGGYNRCDQSLTSWTILFILHQQYYLYYIDEFKLLDMKHARLKFKDTNIQSPYLKKDSKLIKLLKDKLDLESNI